MSCVQDGHGPYQVVTERDHNGNLVTVRICARCGARD